MAGVVDDVGVAEGMVNVDDSSGLKNNVNLNGMCLCK